MATLQVNGTDFLTGDLLVSGFSDVDGGPLTFSLAAFNPAGPNAGNNSTGVTVNQWTDTLIELAIVEPSLNDNFLREVTLDDLAQTYSVTFDVNPDIPYPIPIPVIEDYSYVDFYDTITNTPGFASFSCGNLATMNAVDGVFFYATNSVSSGMDGVRLTVDGLPVDYRVSVDPSFFGGGIIDDGFFLFADPALNGTQVTAAQPLDINGDPLGAPTALQFNYNSVISAGIDSGNPDRVHIDWDFCPETPTQVVLNRCAGNEVGQYYDPLGPNAGLNPVGSTIIQWDTNDIIIDHPAMIGAGVINRIETRDQYGRTMFVVGDPIPTV